MKIGYIADKDAAVYSDTKETIKQYLAQKSRHTKTSIHYLPFHKIILGAWHLINILFLFTLLLGFYNSWFFLPFILKMITDILIVKINQSKFGYKFKIVEIIYHQIIYDILIVVNFINALFKEDKWK